MPSQLRRSFSSTTTTFAYKLYTYADGNEVRLVALIETYPTSSPIFTHHRYTNSTT
jgi:hypothetical protein